MPVVIQMNKSSKFTKKKCTISNDKKYLIDELKLMNRKFTVTVL